MSPLNLAERASYPVPVNVWLASGRNGLPAPRTVPLEAASVNDVEKSYEVVPIVL